MTTPPEPAPPSPPSPPPLPPPSPTRRFLDFTSVRRRFTKRRVAIISLLLVVGGFLYFVLVWNTPEAQIRRAVDDFATAVDTGDQATIVELLCMEEAAAITEDDDYDPKATGVEPATSLDRQISDISITGDTASVRVAFSAQESTTIYLRKEKGTWHICASAAGQAPVPPLRPPG